MINLQETARKKMTLHITKLIFILLVCSLAVFSVGCYKNNTPPEIVKIFPTHVTPLKPDITPPARIPSVPPGWITLSERNWTMIIIHHTATANGNMVSIDKSHKERGWVGIGYDFVIGNGSYSQDGQVEVTFRWKQQITGAHTGGTPGNRVNEEGIGICLVGDFNQSSPSERQMRELARLVKFLQSRYNIPSSQIFGHGNAPGGHPTDCPGANFSMFRLKSML